MAVVGLAETFRDEPRGSRRTWTRFARFAYSDAVKVIVVVVGILVMPSVVMVAYSRVFHMVMNNEVLVVDVAWVASMLYH